MFSRLSRQALSVHRQRNVLPYIQQQVRAASDDEEYVFKSWTHTNERTEFDEIKPWRERVVTELTNDAPVYPTVFESPERDLVNFPRRELQESPNQTRMIIFPEAWFKTLYGKMGVCGPYTLVGGFFFLLAQKEILITYGHQWNHLMAWYLWWYFFTRSQLGDIASYILNYDSRESVEGGRAYQKDAIENRLLAIEMEKDEQAVAEGTQYIFDTKKENVGLQLEAAYRENAMDIYNQVKRRLDYQVEVNKIDSRIKQQFMVKWVIDEVQKTLSKTSEADTLKQCLSDLNVLANRVQKTV